MQPDPVMASEIDALFSDHMAYLTWQLSEGQIDIGEWQISMREDLRHAHSLQLVAGAGGDASKVDANDWLRLGSTVRSQDGYLEDFARQIAAGEVDPASATGRAALYEKSAKTTYSRQAMPDMPVYPGETACLGNCLCFWRDNGDGSYTWDRTNESGSSCDDCIANEQQYQNYVPEGNNAD